MQFLKQLFRFQKRLVIEMLQQDIFQITDSLNLLLQDLLIKEFADLESNLGILVPDFVDPKDFPPSLSSS